MYLYDYRISVDYRLKKKKLQVHFKGCNHYKAVTTRMQHFIKKGILFAVKTEIARKCTSMCRECVETSTLASAAGHKAIVIPLVSALRLVVIAVGVALVPLTA